jgi:hypothetical protein
MGKIVVSADEMNGMGVVFTEESYDLGSIKA